MSRQGRCVPKYLWEARFRTWYPHNSLIRDFVSATLTERAEAIKRINAKGAEDQG